ncbi:MAG: PAS domain S-box protein [Chloroflexota bacterium]
MNSPDKELNANQITEIVALIQRIADGDLDARGSVSDLGNDSDIIISGLNSLAERLSMWELNLGASGDRLNSVLASIIAISSLQFDHKADVSGHGDMLDAVGVGLNALGEELQASVVSREFLDNILVSMVDSLIVLDENAKIHMVNQSALDLLRYGEHELIGQTLESVTHDQDMGTYTPESLSKVAFVRDKEIYFESKYGMAIPVSYSLSVLRDDGGNFLGAVCVGHDITSMLKDREIIQDSELRYRTLFEQSPFGIMVIDPETKKLVETNQALADMLGYSTAEIAKLKIADIEGMENIEETQQHIDRILIEGQNEFETKLKTKSGKIVDVIVNSQALEFSGKAVLLDIVVDITQRKKYADDIKASLEEKEVLIKEIHHRVKNNLQIISSLLYLQSKRTEDENSISILRDSQNRVKAMALIHEKLYQSSDLANVDLGEYLEGIVRSLFQTYGTSRENIKLDIQVAGINMGVEMAIPCGMIVNELVSNALKHAFNEDAKGKISINVVNPKTGECTLILSDNGTGFPADLDFKNTNSLGLQLVNNLVSQLNGELRMNRLTKGTEFVLNVFERENIESKSD